MVRNHVVAGFAGVLGLLTATTSFAECGYVNVYDSGGEVRQEYVCTREKLPTEIRHPNTPAPSPLPAPYNPPAQKEK